MKLLQLQTRKDFGDELTIKVLQIKSRCVLQLSLYTTDYASSPYLQISIGNGRLLDVLFWVYRCGFDFELFGTTWNYGGKL